MVVYNAVRAKSLDEIVGEKREVGGLKCPTKFRG